MIQVHGASVLFMWVTGGMAFLWVTTRRRQVGIGYGWTIRITYICIGALGVATAFLAEPYWPREIAAIAMLVASSIGLAVSWTRRKAGVAGQRERVERRSAAVAEMTGIDRETQRFDRSVPEFPPILDLIPPLVGVICLVFAASHSVADSDGSFWLALFRLVAGAAFLGAVSDAMLLGHWYLVQPGLARAPILELVKWTAITWPIHAVAFVLPTGMFAVLSGSIDDGYGGALGWFWAASTVATLILIGVTRAALRERQYAAVMAATGLLYLAILTAFGQDLVGRILLGTEL